MEHNYISEHNDIHQIQSKASMNKDSGKKISEYHNSCSMQGIMTSQSQHVWEVEFAPEMNPSKWSNLLMLHVASSMH